MEIKTVGLHKKNWFGQVSLKLFYCPNAYLRCEFDFLKVHGIMNTSGLFQSKGNSKGFALTLQETRIIHDSMNLPKIEFITYIYILLLELIYNLGDKTILYLIFHRIYGFVGV